MKLVLGQPAVLTLWADLGAPEAVGTTPLALPCQRLRPLPWGPKATWVGVGGGGGPLT